MCVESEKENLQPEKGQKLTQNIYVLLKQKSSTRPPPKGLFEEPFKLFEGTQPSARSSGEDRN